MFKVGIIDIKENSNLINKLYIDEDNLTNLLWVASSTNAKIVVISSWATTNDWPIIEQYLIKRGLPVIDRITHNKRVYFIKKYIFLNNISNFVILDDEYFKGYNLYQEHFIHCNFYNAGFDYDMAREAIYKLKRN